MLYSLCILRSLAPFSTIFSAKGGNELWMTHAFGITLKRKRQGKDKKTLRKSKFLFKLVYAMS
jgi:hypothetical protein